MSIKKKKRKKKQTVKIKRGKQHYSIFSLNSPTGQFVLVFLYTHT